MAPFQYDIRGRAIAFSGSFPNLGIVRLFLERKAGRADSPYYLYETIRLIGRIPPCTPEFLNALATSFAARYKRFGVRLDTRASSAAGAAECFLHTHVDCIDLMREVLIELLNEEETKLAATAAMTPQP